MTWVKYNSIKSPENVQQMLGEPVILTEKIDGCNFSVHIDAEGRHSFHSRSLTLGDDADHSFSKAIELANSILPRLVEHPLTTFYFEYYGSGIQRRIPYGERQLILIDILDCDDHKFYTYNQLMLFGEVSNISYVPAYMSGESQNLTVDLINAIRNGEGEFANSLVCPTEFFTEGIVARHEDERVDARGNRMISKIKSNVFLAKEHKPKKDMKPRPKIPNEVIDYVMEELTEDRLSSVYSHGEFEPTYSMSDMRHLVKLVPQDMKSEENETWNSFSEKVIISVINKRLPVVLQDFLLKRVTSG